MSNEKEVTIYDIAKQLNISPATVSRGLKDHPAISKKTKKMIFDLVEKIGYQSNHFARNLRNQKTHTIGVIVPRLNSNFMSSVIAGIESIANSQGYNLINHLKGISDVHQTNTIIVRSELIIRDSSLKKKIPTL